MSNPTRSDLIASGALIDLRANHPDASARARLEVDCACSAALYARLICNPDPAACARVDRADGQTPEDRAARLLHAYAHTIARRGPRIVGNLFSFALPAHTPSGDVLEVGILARIDLAETPGDPPALTFSLMPDSVD